MKPQTLIHIYWKLQWLDNNNWKDLAPLDTWCDEQIKNQLRDGELTYNEPSFTVQHLATEQILKLLNDPVANMYKWRLFEVRKEYIIKKTLVKDNSKVLLNFDYVEDVETDNTRKIQC